MYEEGRKYDEIVNGMFLKTEEFLTLSLIGDLDGGDEL